MGEKRAVNEASQRKNMFSRHPFGQVTHLIVSVIKTVGSSFGSSWSLCIIMKNIITAFMIIIILTVYPLSPAVMNHPEHEAGLARPAVTHQHNLTGLRTSILLFP